jgi:hypothetical protein
MARKKFLPPVDPSIWNTLLSADTVIGYGDTKKYYMGKRRLGRMPGNQSVGAGVGQGVSSVFWNYVQPALEQIGRSAVEEVVQTVKKHIRGRGHKRKYADIFDNSKHGAPSKKKTKKNAVEPIKTPGR